MNSHAKMPLLAAPTHRTVVLANLWSFCHEHEVKWMAGMSAVEKTRKANGGFFMSCPAQCVWRPASSRANAGLRGGDALTRLWVAGHEISISGFNETNSFTSVVVPKWRSYWQACLAVRAVEVWNLLRRHLRAVTQPMDGFIPLCGR